MSVALIISSFVAASRIGGAAQQYVLAAHRIDPVLTPTVMFGRSPAAGAQGEVTAPPVLRRMLADIEADAMFGLVDLVITGHFSSPAQVEIAAELLERVRTGSERRPIIVVDPIMGDAPTGLYVSEEVAAAVRDRLVPLADWLTPNVWELEQLALRPVYDPASAAAAAQSLGRPVLVTSVPAQEGEIGLLLSHGAGPVLFAHSKIASAPKGAGDLVTASFAAGLVEGLEPIAAAERAARAAAEMVQAASDWQTSELPLVAMADRLVRPSAAVRIERL